MSLLLICILFAFHLGIVLCYEQLIPKTAKIYGAMEAVDEIEGRGKRSHHLTLRDPLLNAFEGCDCPCDYSLIISTTAPYTAYCQRICVDQNVSCINNNMPLCQGDSFALNNCTAAAMIGTTMCRAGCFGNSWSFALISNGGYYCMSQSGSLSSTSKSCPYGLNTQCYDLVAVGPCTAINGNFANPAMYPLLEIPCKPKRHLVYSSSLSE